MPTLRGFAASAAAVGVGVTRESDLAIALAVLGGRIGVQRIEAREIRRDRRAFHGLVNNL